MLVYVRARVFYVFFCVCLYMRYAFASVCVRVCVCVCVCVVCVCVCEGCVRVRVCASVCACESVGHSVYVGKAKLYMRILRELPLKQFPDTLSLTETET